MVSKIMSRTSGILMLVVFFINVYIGIGDKTLQQYNTAHLYLNWLIAVADILAVIFLFASPLDKFLVLLSGVAWPIVYIGSLALDVATHLCLGGGNCTLWPTTQAAYDYLILGYASEGWVLWPYTMITAITILVAILAISVANLIASSSSAATKSPSPSPTNLGRNRSCSPQPSDSNVP